MITTYYDDYCLLSRPSCCFDLDLYALKPHCSHPALSDTLSILHRQRSYTNSKRYETTFLFFIFIGTVLSGASWSGTLPSLTIASFCASMITSPRSFPVKLWPCFWFKVTDKSFICSWFNKGGLPTCPKGIIVLPRFAAFNRLNIAFRPPPTMPADSHRLMTCPLTQQIYTLDSSAFTTIWRRW